MKDNKIKKKNIRREDSTNFTHNGFQVSVFLSN